MYTNKRQQRRCAVCGEKIPQERLEAVPDTQCCVRHAMVRVRTVRDVDVDGADAEDLRHSFQQSASER